MIFVEVDLLLSSDKYFMSLSGSHPSDTSCSDLFFATSAEFPDEIVMSLEVDVWKLSSYKAIGVGIMCSLVLSRFFPPLGSRIHSFPLKEWWDLNPYIWPQNSVEWSDESNLCTLGSLPNDCAVFSLSILLSLLARFWEPSLLSAMSSRLQWAFKLLFVSRLGWLGRLRIIVVQSCN